MKANVTGEGAAWEGAPCDRHVPGQGRGLGSSHGAWWGLSFHHEGGTTGAGRWASVLNGDSTPGLVREQVRDQAQGFSWTGRGAGGCP